MIMTNNHLRKESMMDDLETCSLCLKEVPYKFLREVLEENKVIYTGALVCAHCRTKHNLKTGRV